MNKSFVDIAIGDKQILRLHKMDKAPEVFGNTDAYAMILSLDEVSQIQKNLDESFPRMRFDEQET
jgi:hypothetical protein